MSTLFAPVSPSESPALDDTHEDNTNYLEALVGEGKKYKDPLALAKAAVHKDQHISTLEAENQRMRQELQTRMSLEEFYNKTKETTSSPTVTSNPEGNNPIGERTNNEAPAKTLSLEDISALVRDALSQESAKQSREKNLAETRNQLIKTYGNNFIQVVNDKAQELGVSSSFLEDLAGKSPKALLKLLDEGKSSVNPNLGLPPSTRTQSTIAGVSGNGISGERNKAYYDKLMKTNPKEYWSSKMQVQRHNDALRLGEKFFS